MITQILRRIFLGVLFLCSLSAYAVPIIDQPMPSFDLPDVNGAKHTLDEYKGKVVVLAFVSVRCPFSRGVDPQMIALQKAYADKGVVVIGVNANASESVEEIKKAVDAMEWPGVMLRDEGNRYADVVGAKTTPECFVIDKTGKLVYQGAFDDRKQPETAGSVHYVENAVTAILDGKSVDPKQVRSWGCSIKRVSKS